MEGPASPEKKDVLSKKEEFFQNLNLLATKRVKVKYCRTIKERLRATTKEESLSLPGSSRSKLLLSPQRRKPEDPPLFSNKETDDSRDADSSFSSESPSSSSKEAVEIQGGINVLKSIKKRKSDRLKNVTPPSTKSLLSYLQPKRTEDEDLEDSSSVDSTETGCEPIRLKEISISVNRLSNRHVINQNPQLRFNLPGLDRNKSPEDINICGFSNEISEKTFSKNEQLKNIISDLESEILEKEREHKKEYLKKVLTEAYDDLDSEPKLMYPQPLELHLNPKEQIRMRLLEEFNIVSESDSEEDESSSSSTSLPEGKQPAIPPSSAATLSASDTSTSTGVPRETETEVSVDQVVKSECVEEYSEFLPSDLLQPAKEEYLTETDLLLSADSKHFQQALSLDDRQMCRIHEEPLDIKPVIPAASSSSEKTEQAVSIEDQIAMDMQRRGEDSVRKKLSEFITNLENSIEKEEQSEDLITPGTVNQDGLKSGQTSHGELSEMCRYSKQSSIDNGKSKRDNDLSTSSDNGAGKAFESSETNSGNITSNLAADRNFEFSKENDQISAVTSRYREGSEIDITLELSNEFITFNPEPAFKDKSSDEENEEQQDDIADKEEGKIEKKAKNIKPRKRYKERCNEIFIKKQMELLENLKNGSETLSSNVMIKKKQKSFKDKKLKRLRDGVKNIQQKQFKSKLNRRRKKLKRKADDTKISDSGEGDTAACFDSNRNSVREAVVGTVKRRRRSTEVTKLGVNLEKTYKQIIMTRKPAAPPPRLTDAPKLFEMDRDDRDLAEILKDKDRSKVERKRRGEPYFLVPFNSGNQRLDQLVNRVRQQLLIYSRRNRFLEAEVNILDRNVYWTPKEEDKVQEKKYMQIILGVDQISKATRKSKTFSRLARPGMDDVLKARRILGIDTAEFNYDAEDVEESVLRRAKERLQARKKKASPKSSEKTVRKKENVMKRKETNIKRDIMRMIQFDSEEFDIDNIEALVDNQPVDDSTDSSDSWSEARSELSPKWSGKYICAACGTSFPTKQGLELHEKKQLTCKPFSCKVCDKRFRSHKLCMKHQSLHGKSGIEGRIPVNFNCDQCPASFPTENGYIKHRYEVHPRKKAFKCSIDSCGKSFMKKLSLEQHINKHRQPWKCGKCHARFSDKSAIKRHIQNVHEMQKELRAQYEMINVSKEHDDDVNYDLDSIMLYDLGGVDVSTRDIPEHATTGSIEYVTSSVQQSKDQNIQIQEPVTSLQSSTFQLDEVVHSGLQEPRPGLHEPVSGLHEDPPPETSASAECFTTVGYNRVEEAATPVMVAQQELQAANRDLDVEVEFVDTVSDIDGLLDSPCRETLVLIQQDNSRVDLNESVDEDIENIQNFLQTEQISSDEQSQESHVTEQPSSEDIGEIKKFLESSSSLTSPELPAFLDKPVSDVTKEPSESTSQAVSRFRIPRSPQFKKRLVNKEIVSIKGLDQTKSPEKSKMRKTKKISFEEQLAKGDVKEKREKKEAKRKNKSSLKDFMITKKYAKLNISKPAELPAQQTKPVFKANLDQPGGSHEKANKSSTKLDRQAVPIAEQSEKIKTHLLKTKNPPFLKSKPTTQTTAKLVPTKEASSQPVKNVSISQRKDVNIKPKIENKSNKSENLKHKLIVKTPSDVKLSLSKTVPSKDAVEIKKPGPAGANVRVSVGETIPGSGISLTPSSVTGPSGGPAQPRVSPDPTAQSSQGPRTTQPTRRVSPENLSRHHNKDSLSTGSKLKPSGSNKVQATPRLSPEVQAKHSIHTPSTGQVALRVSPDLSQSKSSLGQTPRSAERQGSSTGPSDQASSKASAAPSAVVPAPLVKSKSLPSKSDSPSARDEKPKLGKQRTVHTTTLREYREAKRKELSSRSSQDSAEKPLPLPFEKLPPDIDLERIVRQPGKLGRAGFLKSATAGPESTTTAAGKQSQSCPASENLDGSKTSPADSLPSTECLKQVLSVVNPSAADRPRDPRLHSSKQLKNQAQPSHQSPEKTVKVDSVTVSVGQVGETTATSTVSRTDLPTDKERSSRVNTLNLPSPVPTTTIVKEDESSERLEGQEAVIKGRGSEERDLGRGYYTDKYKSGSDETASSSSSASSEPPPSFGASLLNTAALVASAATASQHMKSGSKYSTLLPTNFPTFDAPKSAAQGYSSSMQPGSMSKPGYSSVRVPGSVQQPMLRGQYGKPSSCSSPLIQLTPSPMQYTTPVVSTRSVIPPSFKAFGADFEPPLPRFGPAANSMRPLAGLAAPARPIGPNPLGAVSAQVRPMGIVSAQVRPIGAGSATIGPNASLPSPVSSFVRKPFSSGSSSRPKLPALPKPVPAAMVATPKNRKPVPSCGICKTEFKTLSDLTKHECIVQKQLSS